MEASVIVTPRILSDCKWKEMQFSIRVRKQGKTLSLVIHEVHCKNIREPQPRNIYGSAFNLLENDYSWVNE